MNEVHAFRKLNVSRNFQTFVSLFSQIQRVRDQPPQSRGVTAKTNGEALINKNGCWREVFAVVS